MKTHMTALVLVPLWLAVAPAWAADAQSKPPGSGSASALSLQKECSLTAQLETLRAGLGRGSGPLKTFLRKQLRERAATLPEAELRAAFERERDPMMIEELSGALAARMARHN